ncbi:MAG: NifB/NifX family molybdenum-iron cluster-binding protein [Lachnotalea sp.]
MKIAVTYENGEIFQHFGHTEQVKIYEVENSKIISSQVLSTIGSGHGALAVFLQDQGVDTLICGGIGGGAKTALEEASITLFGGVTGDADSAVKDFLESNLNYDANVECKHHENEEHSCGEHTCDSH